ncbi:phenol hydroxylase [Sphingomonas sp. Root710]|uniref:phenol hydroxylase subunit P4 n=1 Tax=Sphingomonas sp. Root710 TaxID=1736594 RepID=UPI0006F60CEE|nr:phenol hydroxylase subunit P4 [Sphingomonas sp. Root710]KRB83910.1 phenol hydroxylase [Sphingomonas sp. Root710]
MTVRAIRDYVFEPADSEEKFQGARVVYVGWDGHLMFSSPYAWALPPDLLFADFLADQLNNTFGSHPDWSKIDWTKTTWTKNDEVFLPDLNGTIVNLGIAHKDALRFNMPGLGGIGGLGI